MTNLRNSTVGFAAAVFVGALLVRAPLWWLPLPLAGDASAYLLYSKMFLEHGMEGLRHIVQSFGPEHPLAAYPLPLRLLPVWLGALAGKLAGGLSANCLFGLSYICSAAAAAVGASFGRDLGLRGTPLAWLAALLIVSPVAAIFSVRAGVDSLLALVWCGMFFTHHRAWTRGSSGWAIATGVLFGAALLTKESSGFLLLVLGVAALWYRVGAKRAIPRGLVAALVAGGAMALGILAWAAGGMEELFAVYRRYAAGLESLPYTVKFNGGPWHAYLVDWMLLSPVVLVLGIVGLTRSGPLEARVLCAGLLTAAVVILGQLPVLVVRQLLAFDFALRIGVVLLAAELLERQTAAPRRLALGLLALAFGSELASLLHYFVFGEIYDPTHYKLLLRSGMIPP